MWGRSKAHHCFQTPVLGAQGKIPRKNPPQARVPFPPASSLKDPSEGALTLTLSLHPHSCLFCLSHCPNSTVITAVYRPPVPFHSVSSGHPGPFAVPVQCSVSCMIHV